MVISLLSGGPSWPFVPLGRSRRHVLDIPSVLSSRTRIWPSLPLAAPPVPTSRLPLSTPVAARRQCGRRVRSHRSPGASPGGAPANGHPRPHDSPVSPPPPAHLTDEGLT